MKKHDPLPRLRRSICGIAICATMIIVASGCGHDQPPPPPPTVTIAGHTWTVELAMDQASRYQGLSDRISLAHDAGMLFLYPQPMDVSYCMRDCYIPLDIAFIDANGFVVQTYGMKTEPRHHETAVFPSGVPIQYVLEVNLHDLDKAAVKVGDHVTFSAGVPAASTSQGE
jgi:uncharacterized membrane protein (UPF0127 family)